MVNNKSAKNKICGNFANIFFKIQTFSFIAVLLR